MGKLIIVVLAAAIVWSGYWFVGATALDRGVAAMITDLERAGWRLNDPDYSVRGFPNRFDTTFRDIDATSPDGIAVRAPIFQLLALSYRPNRVIAAFPPRIEIDSPAGAATVTTETARGSLSVATARTLPLERSSFVADGLRIDSVGDTLAMGQLRLASRIPDGAPDGRHQNIGLDITDLALPGPLIAQAGAQGSGVVDHIRADATLDFAAPIDRTALENVPDLDRIDIHDLEVEWGELGLTGEGVLDIGADGRPLGTIELTLVNWRGALGLAASLGLIPAAQRGQIEGALSFFASGDTLELPLRFEGGTISLGPVPIATAPVLR